jgi:hypothetical protein
MNRGYNQLRRVVGLSYWSLSAYLKHKTKRAVQHIANFEQVVAHEARKYEVDGVVCGHIHHAKIRTIDGIQYCNTGDWVESCTALVEHVDGAREVIQWIDPEKILRPRGVAAPSRLGEMSEKGAPFPVEKLVENLVEESGRSTNSIP